MRMITKLWTCPVIGFLSTVAIFSGTIAAILSVPLYYTGAWDAIESGVLRKIQNDEL